MLKIQTWVEGDGGYPGLFLNFLGMRSRKIAALSMNYLGILKSNSKIKRIFLVVALNNSCFNKAFFFFLMGVRESVYFGKTINGKWYRGIRVLCSRLSASASPQ